MNTRHRPQHSLERAVAKALARRAELRAQRDAQSRADRARGDEFPDQTSVTAEILKETALAAERSAARTTAAAPGADRFAETPDTATRQAAATPETPARPRLPAAAMELLERLANRNLDEPVDEQFEADLAHVQFDSKPEGSTPEHSSQAPASEPEPAPYPSAGPGGDNPPRTSPGPKKLNQASKPESPAPAKRPGNSGPSRDAFQLLLSNNPEATDNRRSDLRDAPSMRNPRKLLQDPEQAAEAAPPNQKATDQRPASNSEDASGQSNPENTDANRAEPAERSLRNWFSPKQDPNPPPPPAQDPSRD